MNKRILAALLALTMAAGAIGMTACGSDAPDKNGKDDPKQTTQENDKPNRPAGTTTAGDNGSPDTDEPETQPEGAKETQGLYFVPMPNGEEGYALGSIGEATDTQIVIPATYEGLPVKAILEMAFVDCNQITRVVIPEGIVSIGEYAFLDCTLLEQVELPSTLKEIGSATFGGCKALKEIELPYGLVRIGSMAFSDCGLNRITIPSSVTEMEQEIFSGCEDLTIIFDGTDEELFELDGNSKGWDRGIGNFQFEITGKVHGGSGNGGGNGGGNNTDTTDKPVVEGSKGLEYALNDNGNGYIVIGIGSFNGTELVIGATYEGLPVVGIDSLAFNKNTKITSVIICEGIEEIGTMAFNKCTKLKSVTLPDSLTVLNPSAFADCTALTEITVPAGVTEMGSRVFAGCTALKKATILARVEELKDEFFYGCENLAEIKLSDSIVWIYNRVFAGCTRLKTVTLPEGLDGILSDLFKDCKGLTTVYLPSTMRVIHENAFANCTSLRSIYFAGSVEQWEDVDRDFNWDYNTGRYTVICNDGTVSK